MEQNNFLLEDVDKNLEEYKKAVEIKDKPLSDIENTARCEKKTLKILNKNTSSN